MRHLVIKQVTRYKISQQTILIMVYLMFDCFNINKMLTSAAGKVLPDNNMFLHKMHCSLFCVRASHHLYAVLRYHHLLGNKVKPWISQAFVSDDNVATANAWKI